MRSISRKTLKIIGIIAIIILAIATFLWDPLFLPKILAIAVAFILSIAIAIYAVVDKVFDFKLVTALLLFFIAVSIFYGGICLITIWF